MTKEKATLPPISERICSFCGSYGLSRAQRDHDNEDVIIICWECGAYAYADEVENGD